MARLIWLVLLAPCAAHADPVSLIAAAASFLGAPGWVAFAISAAGSLLQSASARRKQRAAAAAQRAAYNASLQDRNVTVLNNEAPQKIVYGNPAPIGGAMVAIFTSGSKDQYKHLVIVFAAHECAAIDEIYIEGEPVGALDGSGWVTGGLFYESAADITTTELVTFDGSGIGTVSRTVGNLLSIVYTDGNGDTSSFYHSYTGTASGATITSLEAAGLTVSVSYTYAAGNARVNVQKHLSPGGVDTADAFLISAVPSKWTSAHKLSGYTYCVVTLDLNFGRFQGGPPNITARLRGKKIYDYRTTTTAYSNNPALCVADFLTSVAGFGATVGQIDSTAAIAAANACDSQAFTCDGVVSTDNARDANLQQLEDSMAGTTHFSGGVWRIIAGAWASPVMSLTDSTTLADPIEVLQASNPRDGRWNGVRGQYLPSSGLGVTSDFSPYTVASYLAADGAALVKDLQLPMTATNSGCQKLAAIAVEQARLGLTINYPAHLSTWKLQPGDRVTVTNAEYGFAAKPFRVVDWQFSANAPQGLVLTEDAASVWTGTFSVSDPTLATSNLVDPWARPAAPANFAVDSGTGVLQTSSDGTIITRVLCTWQATIVRTILQGGYTQLQWRLSSAVDDKWESMDLPADASSAYLMGLMDGSPLLIRVRFISGLLVQGAWSTLSHVVVGKTEPPSDVASLAINGTVLTWPAITDADRAGYRLRAIAGSTVNWAGGFALHAGVITDPPYTLIAPLNGLYTYMVVAVDTSGNESVTPASVTATGTYTLAGNTLESWPQAPLFDGVISGGAVSGSELLATASGTLFWGGDSNLHWTTDSATYWGVSSYVEMTYTFAFGASAAGLLVLSSTILGQVVAIDIRRAAATPFWSSDAASFWVSDPVSFWTAISGSWEPWPGALVVAAGEYIEMRVTVSAGATQGRISVLTPYLDVPTVEDYIDNAVVIAAGTRLAPVKTFRAIKSIQLTVQQDGGSAVTARWIDKASTGPLVQALDITGTPVPATLDAYLKGY